MAMELEQLAGMWLTDDCRCSMWIGGTDLSRIEICCNRQSVVSEPSQFRYDGVKNICQLSESVILYQLFDEDSILVQVMINGGATQITFNRRKE